MNHFDFNDSNQHFFISNVYGWAVANSPHEAVKKLIGDQTQRVAKGTMAQIFHVPLPYEAYYEIELYAPKVEGITRIWAGKL